MYLVELPPILWHKSRVDQLMEWCNVNVKAVAILPSTAIYPQRLFCHELFVIGQSK